MNRVFIRKYGIFSSLGRNAEEVEDNLFKGKVAIKSDPDRSYFMSSLCGDVPFIENERGLSQAATYAMQTIREIGPLPKNNIGMIYGCDSSTQAVIDCYETLKEKGETRGLSPEHTFKSLNSNITMNLACKLGIDKLREEHRKQHLILYPLLMHSEYSLRKPLYLLVRIEVD